jgi:hypothetical protein
VPRFTVGDMVPPAHPRRPRRTGSYLERGRVAPARSECRHRLPAARALTPRGRRDQELARVP